MEITEVLQAVIPPVVSAAGGWWFGRKKTNADAVASEMDNVEKALAIYRGIVTDLESKVKRLEERLNELEEENHKLRKERNESH